MENQLKFPVFEVKNIYVKTDKFFILRDVQFTARKGVAKVILGESGAGKSTLGFLLAGILKPGLAWKGEIFLEGRRVDPFQEGWRGKRAGIVLQDPYSSFDPRKKILPSVAEPLIHTLGMGKKQAMEKAREWLSRVEFPDSALKKYPHQLSGGLLQRAAIAASLILEPEILIADEPTSALDPPLRAEIREVIRKFSRGRYLLYITHFVEDALYFGQDFLVLYGGVVMEEGAEFYHPYSRLLLSSRIERGKQLPEIEVFSPHPSTLPPGCPFRPRCHIATDRCTQLPPLRRIGNSLVRCWNVP